MITKIISWDAFTNPAAPFSWEGPQRARLTCDLFARNPLPLIRARLGIMAARPQHAFLVRTKHFSLAEEYLCQMYQEAVETAFPTCGRSGRPASFFIQEALSFDLAGDAANILGDGSESSHDDWYNRMLKVMQSCPWPLPNVRIEDARDGTVMWVGAAKEVPE